MIYLLSLFRFRRQHEQLRSVVLKIMKSSATKPSATLPSGTKDEGGSEDVVSVVTTAVGAVDLADSIKVCVLYHYNPKS